MPPASSRCTAEATKTLKPPNKTSLGTSQNTIVHPSKPHQRPSSTSSSLTHSRADVSKLSQVSPPLTGSPYPVPGDQLSFSSSFTVSPESTDLTSVSKVHQSNSVHQGSEFAQFPGQPQFSPLPQEIEPPPDLPQSPSSKAEATRLSHQSLCASKSVLLVSGSLLPGPPLSSQKPASALEEAGPLVQSFSSISPRDELPPDECSRRWPCPTNECAPGHLLSVTQNPQTEGMDVEDDLESGKLIRGGTCQTLLLYKNTKATSTSDTMSSPWGAWTKEILFKITSLFTSSPSSVKLHVVKLWC